MPEKVRADVALVNRGLAESREKAQAAIMAGSVYIGEKKILKASEHVRPEDELLIRAPQLQYVSRGALKLEKAVRVFNADALSDFFDCDRIVARNDLDVDAVVLEPFDIRFCVRFDGISDA